MAGQNNYISLDDFDAALPASSPQSAVPQSNTAPAVAPAMAPAPAASPEPTPAPASAPQPNVAPPPSMISIEDLSANPSQPPVSTPVDIAKTQAAQATKAFLSDMPGMYGAAAYYTTPKLTPEQTEAAYQELTPEELMDVQEGRYTIIPMPPEDYMYSMMPMGSFGIADNPKFKTGKNFTLIPTMQGSEQFVEEQLPYTQYEAQTKIGDILGTGTRALIGTGMMGGGPKSMGAAFLAGGAGRGVGQLMEAVSPTLSGPSEIGTNILVDALSRRWGKIAADIAAPNKEAFDRIAKGVSTTLASDPAKRKLWEDAIKNGRPLNINDFIDPQTKTWLKTNLPGDYLDKILDFEAGLAQRKMDVDNYTTQKFQNIFKEDLSDRNWQTALEKAQAEETNNLYKAVRANPAAQNLITPKLKDLISEPGIIQDAAFDVDALAQKRQLGDDVSPFGLSKKNGKIDIDPFGRPNFDYWDQVKRKLDSEATSYYNAGKKFEGDLYSNAAKKVRDAVSDIIGEYPEARAASQTQKQTPTSLSRGYDFGRLLSSPKPSARKIDEFLKEYRSANPEQKLRYQQGIGRNLLEVAQTGDIKQISRLMSSKSTRTALEEILGAKRFQNLYGTIAQNAMMKTTTGLAEIAQKRTLDQQAVKNPAFRDLLGALASSGTSAGMLTYAGSFPYIQYGAIVPILASGKFLDNLMLDVRERRVAQKAIQLSLSHDPADIERLGELLSKDISAVTALRKYENFITNSIRSGFLASARDQERKSKQERRMEAEKRFVTPDIIPGFNDGQAAGGRVGRKSGGRVANSISAEVERTRSLLSNKTASMLSMPDDAIVTALHHAKNT